MDDLAYKIKADFLKALAHPLRLTIIEFLKSGEQKAGAIAKRLGIPQSSLSRHLTILREGGILRSRQVGTVIFYGIESREIFDVLRPVAQMLRRRLKRTEKVLGSLGKER